MRAKGLSCRRACFPNDTIEGRDTGRPDVQTVAAQLNP